MSLLSFGRGWGGLFLFTGAVFINSRGSSYLGNTHQIRKKNPRMDLNASLLLNTEWELSIQIQQVGIVP